MAIRSAELLSEYILIGKSQLKSKMLSFVKCALGSMEIDVPESEVIIRQQHFHLLRIFLNRLELLLEALTHTLSHLIICNSLLNWRRFIAFPSQNQPVNLRSYHFLSLLPFIFIITERELMSNKNLQIVYWPKSTPNAMTNNILNIIRNA